MSIYITGYGVISSIGNNVAETYASLLSENSGIKRGTHPYTEKYFVGEIPFSTSELVQRFALTQTGSRTAVLGMIAAKEAFSEHTLYTELKTGLISGTSVGGMDLSEKEYAAFLKNEAVDFSVFKEHPNGVSSNQIAAELGITDFVNTISTACSSAANAIMMGARLIRAGRLDRVVVGGTDALTQFTVSGFRSLMIYDEQWCKPFDNDRKGLNLGEGAGFIVLESEKSIQRTQKPILGRLIGWANASDAFHQTASSPDGDGANLAMQTALKCAQIQPQEVDYINAHGTATPNNDLSESKACIHTFSKVPPISSTKAYTGHTLAACGGIEAVISLLSIQNQVLFPNLNFANPIDETKLIPVTQVQQGKEISIVLSNSFGFGGNNSTLIFSK